jgi:hypothetical protein
MCCVLRLSAAEAHLGKGARAARGAADLLPPPRHSIPQVPSSPRFSPGRLFLDCCPLSERKTGAPPFAGLSLSISVVFRLPVLFLWSFAVSVPSDPSTVFFTPRASSCPPVKKSLRNGTGQKRGARSRRQNQARSAVGFGHLPRERPEPAARPSGGCYPVLRALTWHTSARKAKSPANRGRHRPLSRLPAWQRPHLSSLDSQTAY